MSENGSSHSPSIAKSELIKLMLDLHKENNSFVRHYEETRFKFSQITIALAAALVGASKLLGRDTDSKALIASAIVILGVAGIFITLKYTERADRHAAISRAFRKLASSMAGDVEAGTIEATYQAAAEKHREHGLGRLLHGIRARVFWAFLHILVCGLGAAMYFL